ncbi:MAG: phytanoyl-CoA dioxygenase family protein [Acidobacteriota bacterium]
MQVLERTMDLVVTDQDVEFYQEHGWWITPAVLVEDLLNGAMLGLEEHWQGHRDHRLEGAGKGFADWMPGDGDGTRNNEYVSLQNDRVAKLSLAPVIGAMAAKLAGTSAIRLWDDQILVKPVGQKEVGIGWHVDRDYWGTCTSQNLLTAWIPLHDCPEEMGPLVVLDGSHRWSDRLDRTALSFHKQDTDALVREVHAIGEEFKPVSMVMKKGQFSFHHCKTIHGGGTNRGSHPRVGVAVHYQDESNRYQLANRKDGRPVVLFNDQICGRDEKGHPDYRDGRVFPMVWSARELDQGA